MFKEKAYDVDKIIKKIILAHLERLIGYLYSGMLPAILLTIEYPNKMGMLFKSMGSLLSFLAVYCIGICIFCTYFHVIGEFFLYPIQHTIHYILDKTLLQKLNGNRVTSTIRFLKENYGISFLHARSTYELVKNEFFVKQQRYSIHFMHGELHVLGLSGIILLVYYFIINENIYLYLSIVSLIIWFVSDTKQHSKEAILMNKEKEQIRKFLIEEKIIS